MCSPFRALVWFASIAMLGCGGGGGDVVDDDGTGPNYSLGIQVSSSTVSIPAADSATVSVTITRGGGYAGTVRLEPGDVVAGIDMVFSPSALTGTATSSTVMIRVARSVAAGNLFLSIRAAGDGVNTASAPLTVNITPPRDFSIRVLTAQPDVLQGGSALVGVEVVRTGGFTDPVALAIDGLPSGVTGAFLPTTVTQTGAQLTLTATASAAVGSYQATIRGTSTGLPERSVTLAFTVHAANTPGFAIVLSLPSLSVQVGGTASIGVTIQRTGGFAGAVTLSSEGHPTGTTWEATPNPASGTTSTVTYTVGAATTPGSYTVTVRADASGMTPRSVTFTLTVLTVPGVRVTLFPAQVTVSVGGPPQPFRVNIERFGGFSGAVSLTVSGLPAGITTTVPGSPTDAVDVNVTVGAASGVAPGTYTGTVRASAPGILDAAATLTVTVVASGTRIEWKFCAPNASPLFFAYQDGINPFVAVQPDASGAFVITISAGRGAVVYVLPGIPEADDPSRGATTYYRMASTTELQSFAAAACPMPGPRKTLTGTVAGLLQGDGFAVTLGDAAAIMQPGSGTAYTLSSVPDGARDLVSGRVTFTSDGGFANRILLRRDVNLPSGATIPMLDFSGAEAFDPQLAQLTLTGVPTGANTVVTSAFITANGTTSPMLISDPGTSTVLPFRGVPTARLRTGDLHTIVAIAGVPNSGREQRMTLVAREVSDRTIALAAELSAPQVSLYATTPVPRLRAAGQMGTTGTAFGGYIEVAFAQEDLARAWVISETREWMQSTTSAFEVRTPVLTGLTGWNEAAWGTQLGSLVKWTVDARSGPPIVVTTDGAVLRQFVQRGQFVP